MRVYGFIYNILFLAVHLFHNMASPVWTALWLTKLKEKALEERKPVKPKVDFVPHFP